MDKANEILFKHLNDSEAKYVADKRWLHESIINAINEALSIQRVVGQSRVYKI